MSSDPIPSRVRDILALFEGPLADARFGDLDAGALDELAARVRDRAREVDDARASLDAAHAALEEARAILSRRAEQGLAYAKVFAEGDPALAADLASLDGEPELRAPRRARKKNGAERGDELPLTGIAGGA